MSASEFHAIGVAADAPALASGTSVAQAMGTDTKNVQGFLNAICGGMSPILLPRISAFRSQVPAYEQIFWQAQSQCPKATPDLLARERGRVARSIASGQEFLNSLAGTSSAKVNGFCAELQKSERIDSKLIGAAAGELGVKEDGTQLVELGVSLMIKNCSQLLDRVVG
jgi:hypothetical protein